MRYLLILLPFFLIHISSYACEETEEYKEFRWEHIKNARKAVNECESSFSNLNYWYAYAQCLDMQNTGKYNEDFICGRDAAHKPEKFKKHKINIKYCSVFDVDGVAFNRFLEEEMSVKKVSRCKK